MLVVKSVIINKISNYTVDFSLDKTFFSNDMLKNWMHEFGFNERHIGPVLTRLEEIIEDQAVYKDILKKFKYDLSNGANMLHNDYIHLQEYMTKEVISRCLKHALNVTMSENQGTNLKSKIVKLLNLFMSLRDQFVEHSEPIEKKKNKKRRSKNKKEETNQNTQNNNNLNVRSSVSSDTEDHNTSNLSLNTLDDLWEYFTHLANSKYTYFLKQYKD